MFGLLIQKELRIIIYSPKFVITFAICAVLILMSVFIGINEYRSLENQYQTSRQVVLSQLNEETGWRHLTNVAQRPPNPLQIFASGVSYDVGRHSTISSEENVQLRRPYYSDNLLFAIFRIIDFSFIVQFILTIFAVLFTYNAVNGEREKGTLKLVFSNALPRAKFLMAKCIGSWLGLVIPLSVPVLLSLLLVLVYGIPFDNGDWLKIGVMLLLSMALFSFFIVLGVMISSFFRRSHVSFLVALLVWVLLVLIIPRAGVLAAGQIVEVPRVAEIEGQRDAYAKDRWQQYQKDMHDRWAERADQSCPATAEDDDDESMKWLDEEEEERRKIEQQIDEYYEKLRQDLKNKNAARNRLANMLSRLSPVSAYQLAVINIAGTDVELKDRYEDSMNEYRSRFLDFVQGKLTQNEGRPGGIMISFSSETGFNLKVMEDKATLDLSDMPEYIPPEVQTSKVMAASVADFGILCVGIVIAFAAAFVRFLRYDIR